MIRTSEVFKSLGLCTATLFMAFGMKPGMADPGGGVFQLDGNAYANDPPMTGGDDWDTLYGGGGSQTAFTDIVPDFSPTYDTIFTGGGSKTPNLVEDWDWKSSPPPPDKDNITHAEAANYVVSGHQIIVFGADLYADNGDAELAFWFFQDDVATQPPYPATSGDFHGMHINGDVYVAVKFSTGGTQANIAVYEWDDTCTKPPGKGPFPVGSCAADNIRVLVAQGPALCGSGAPETSIACAITNTANKPSPWPYQAKGWPTANQFPPTTFFEGGIDIYNLFSANKCFSAFGVTTGASTSFTSTAKDFVLNSFDVCSVAATKTCVNDDEANETPTSISYNVRGCAINDGGGDIVINSLLNSIAGGTNAAPAGLAWYTPGMVDDGGGLRDFDPSTDCDDTNLLKQAVDNGGPAVTDLSMETLASGEALVYQFTETTSMNAVSDTVTIDADGTDGTDINDATAGATCPQRTFAAGLNVTKRCAADLVDVGSALQVKINVKGMVCNTGEVTLTNLQLSDSSMTPASGTVTLTPVSTTLRTERENRRMHELHGFLYAHIHSIGRYLSLCGRGRRQRAGSRQFFGCGLLAEWGRHHVHMHGKLQHGNLPVESDGHGW